MTKPRLFPLDAVLLESVDGRPHLAQVRPVFAAKKRVFVDKPFTASYADAREIVRLSRESGVPFFSSSSLRFVAEVQEIRNSAKHGGITGAFTFGMKAVLATPVPMRSDYRNLVVEIVKFFQTGVPPIPPDETLEIIAFMEAA